jgi:hypothetical protein
MMAKYTLKPVRKRKYHRDSTMSNARESALPAVHHFVYAETREYTFIRCSRA